ncbi:MAG: hypothetical protein CSA23_04305 [Deltaproteobacteria bacterium]|nr:MAG: hypothetical protein CSA23_04305 [Deltaproteobacteria bacterium]
MISRLRVENLIETTFQWLTVNRNSIVNVFTICTFLHVCATDVFCDALYQPKRVIIASDNRIQNLPQSEPQWSFDEFVLKAGGSIRYIDFEGGDDNNSGLTKEEPWKHHPWDLSAKSKAKQEYGIHTYIFKGGVIYRGNLIADESGLPDQPIRLSCLQDWGRSQPIVMSTKKITGTWEKCSRGQFVELDSDVADQIWHVDWPHNTVPRTLYEITNQGIFRLALAREPDWLSLSETKGDDVKSDWWECDEASIELKIYIDKPSIFEKGSAAQFVDNNSRTVIENATIKAVNDDYLVVEIPKNGKVDISRAQQIVIGSKNVTIYDVSGTHDIMTYLHDSDKISQYRTIPNQYRQGGVVWAEDFTGSRVLPSQILGLNTTEGTIYANFHYNVNGPVRFSRYFIENLPFLLDSPGEFYFSKDRKKLFVRLSGDQDPNTAHLEAGDENVILSIHGQSHISIENLHFAGANEIPIAENSAEYWRGGLHNSAIQISGNASHISVNFCNFTNLPFGVISFCSDQPESEVIEHIAVENNRFEDIGGSAVTLSAISRLRSGVRNNGKVGRLRHAVLKNNVVNMSGLRRLSLWGFDHALCIVDAELSEVAYNITKRTAGAGVIVFGPPYFNQYGDGPRLNVPVQRNLIHHNWVEDSLLSLQDYGGISYWHGGPAYIYNNVSVNPVGYKHTHHRKKNGKSSDCYRSSCFGVGLYADHGYKVYAFDNFMSGKTSDCSLQFYNSCGWNEAAGFLNTVFNNEIVNFTIAIRKGMAESNRSIYVGNNLYKAHDAYFRLDAEHVEFDTLAFENNSLKGEPASIATGFSLGTENGEITSLAAWKDYLKQKQAISNNTGTLVTSEPPIASDDIENITRVFVPWGLAYQAGEYHFIPYPKEITRINDEHLYWNSDWKSRETVRTDTSRNDLIGVGIEDEDFVDGVLENWNRGALRLNGRNQYIKADSTNLFVPKRNKCILEFVVKLQAAGPICYKLNKSDLGYRLDVLVDGSLQVSHKFGVAPGSTLRASQTSLLDGEYHHLLIEIDEDRADSSRLFVDGQEQSVISEPFSFGAKSDLFVFMIGYDGKSYLPCEIDFFRFAQGTLAEAETKIEELYDWQFARAGLPIGE